MNREILDQMLADQEKAGARFQPSQFWRDCTSELIGLLETKGIENFRTFPYFNPEYRYWLYKNNSGLFDFLRGAIPRLGPGKKLARGLDGLFFGVYAAQENYRIYLAADKADAPPVTREFTSSREGGPLPRDVYEIDGKLFTRASLMYLKGLAMLKKNADLSGVRTVFEIGGGYGALGEVFLKAGGGDYFYVDVDIPPTSYFSTYYLKRVFGEENVLGYDQSRDLEKIDLDELRKSYRAVVLCPWQVERVTGKIDLAVNYTSFQEMEESVVNGYADEIARLGADFVLTRNKKHGIVAKTVEQKVTMERIIAMFERHNYAVLDRDAIAFGDGLPGVSQEAAVLSRAF